MVTPILRPYGGRETYVENVSRRLAKTDKVTIYASEVRMSISGVEIVELKSFRIPAGSGTLGYYIPVGLKEEIEREGADLIFSQEVYQGSFLVSSWVASDLGIHHVSVHHGGFKPMGVLQRVAFDLYRRILGKVSGRTDAFICVSPHLSSDLLEIHGRVRIEYIPPGIDVSELKKFRRLKEDGDYVLLPGRLLEWKIPVEEVRALASRYRTIVAGLDPLKRKHLYERAGAEVYTDLDRESFLELIAKSRVVAFPSLSEGSPITLKEAMAIGKPIVARPVGNIPNLLEGAGIVTENILEGVDVLMSNGELRNSLSERAATRAQSLDWDNIVARIRDLFISLVENPHPSP